MLRKLKALSPPFLRRVDRYLLLHAPALWSSRIHHLLFVSLLGLVAIGAYALLPLDLQRLPSPELQTGLLWLPVSVLGLVWAYAFSHHKLEGRFGKINRFQQMGLQSLYLLGIASLVVLPFLHGQLLDAKLASSVSDRSFIHQVNVLNQGDLFFPLAKADKRIYPDTRFSNRYLAQRALGQEQLVEVAKAWTDEDKLQVIATYQQLVQQYGGYPFSQSPQEVLRAYEQGTYLFVQDQRALHEAISQTDASIHLIAKAKFDTFAFQEASYQRAAYFIAFFVWLCMMVFLRTSLKQFALMLAFLLGANLFGGILVGLSQQVFDVKPELMISALFGLGLTFFLVQAFMDHHTHKLLFWKEIGLGMASLLLPFSTMVYYSTVLSTTSYSVDHMVFGGVFLTFFAWQFIIHPQFVNLKSAPSMD